MQLELPKGPKKYNIIYADPPWKYGFWYKSEAVKRNAADHYVVMSSEDLQRLPVQTIAANDAVLFLWATYPCLPQAMALLVSWGFKYCTVAFTWVKRNKVSPTWFWGLGNYTRANAEICLLARRGKGLPRRSHAVHSILDTPVRAHSQKPDETRDRIVELFGDLPRIELFARTAVPGWAAWGNEVPPLT
jgi:N6-adenosine-specific RNA methylase IME4